MTFQFTLLAQVGIGLNELGVVLRVQAPFPFDPVDVFLWICKMRWRLAFAVDGKVFDVDLVVRQEKVW